MTNQREKTAAGKLTEMLEGLEHSNTFLVEGLKHDISECIFQAMERNRVSRTALAEQLGTSRAYVTKVLQGAANFTLESLVKIGRALDCDVNVQITPRRVETRWESYRRAATPVQAGWRNQNYIHLVCQDVKEDASNVPIVPAA